ncbi:HNH endonuclease signature motif containing protein, partial [Nocardiopsis oceani]
ASGSEADHKRSFSAGGSTSADNIQPLCSDHNRLKYRRETNPERSTWQGRPSHRNRGNKNNNKDKGGGKDPDGDPEPAPPHLRSGNRPPRPYRPTPPRPDALVPRHPPEGFAAHHDRPRHPTRQRSGGVGHRPQAVLFGVRSRA